MAYDVLIEHIIRQGESEGERILAEARGKASLLLSDLEKSIQDLRQQAAIRLEKELYEYRRQAINRARMEGKTLIAVAKGEMMDEFCVEVSASIQTIIEGSSYPAIFDRLLAEALKEMMGNVTVERIRGGVKILSEDKRVTVINTLESRWEKIKEGLMPEIGKVLFHNDHV